MMKFYKCSICGKVMAQVSGPESGIVCCWMPMRELSLSREKRAVCAGDSRCGRDGASCVPPPRPEGASFYAQSRRYLCGAPRSTRSVNTASAVLTDLGI